MKKFVLITLLLSYITIGVYAGKSDALCDKYVRLHILANSNSPFDQLTKESVKDYLLKNYKNEFSSFKTKEETLKFIAENKNDIKKSIDKFLTEKKTNYTCQIKISKENYKKGSYKNINLPYGSYDSVKILLGKGKGKNLFFIMFPALSIKDNVTVKFEDGKKIKYKSKIAELIFK
ncbi:MAG: hypothetical protein E7419_06505 [Ruminococcaceae bacterium]|nr:hypothetical protein [Oscillospiraceae bacterium]